MLGILDSNQKIVSDNNLVFHLDAAQLRSYSGAGNTWIDISGNSNNGTLTNGPTFGNGNGGYIDCDGTNDYINMGVINLIRDWTLEVWVYMDVLDFGILGQGNTGTNIGLHMYYSSGARGMIYGMYSNDADYGNNYRPSTNTWYHWVFTYNNTTYAKQFYANAVLQTPVSLTQNNYLGTGELVIAGNYSIVPPSLPRDFGNGRFAIVRMYSKVLTSAEISQNYNATRRRFGL